MSKAIGEFPSAVIDEKQWTGANVANSQIFVVPVHPEIAEQIAQAGIKLRRIKASDGLTYRCPEILCR